jgi:hypothetical protein
MNKLLRLLSDRAHWEALVLGPLNTLIARGLSFANGYALTKTLVIKIEAVLT